MSEQRPTIESSNRSFYDVDSRTYDQQRWLSKGGTRTDVRQQGIVRKLCENWTNGRVLEVGMGTGRFTIPMLRMGNRVTVADISCEMLEIARQNIEKAGLASGMDEFVESSIYELPFADNSFDHAISVNVFNHLEAPEAALKQIARVVQPRSTLLFNYANLRSYFWLAARQINKSKKAIGQEVYSVWERPSEVRKVVDRVGLDLVTFLGHVHVPRALEKYHVDPLLAALDSVSRSGPLRHLAPFHFCLCRKRP